MDRSQPLNRHPVAKAPRNGMTYRRRTLLFMLASPLVPVASRPWPGDWVRVISMPQDDWESARRAEVRAVGRKYRLCLGKLCQVMDLEESGRVEVDVLEHVRHEFPALIGCSLMYEPGCLRLANEIQRRR